MSNSPSSIKFLAENNDLKVYSIEESVYLKNKKTSKNYNEFSNDDILVTHHYGNPNNAIILRSGRYLIVSGCGLTIYNIGDGIENQVMDEPNSIVWTNGLHQDELDDQNLEFRFVRYNDKGLLRVFKMNAQTLKQVELE